MKKNIRSCRNKAIPVVVVMCGVGVLLLAAGCPLIPPPSLCTSDADCTGGLVCDLETGMCVEPPTGCTSDADCAEGLVCDTETGQCVEPSGCTSDDDCEEGEFCDTQTGECVVNENLFATTALDTDFDRVHGLHQDSPQVDCTDCHHSEPENAGFGDCRECHADDPGDAISFQAVAHDDNESGDGCRMCHGGEWDNCAFCHTALQD